MIHFVKALKKSGASDSNKQPAISSQLRKSTASTVMQDIILTKTRKVEVDKAALKMRRIYADHGDSSTDSIISAYKDLRTGVLSKMDHLKAKSLMITSPVQGNGKTSTALNLAINIAKLGGRTALLVDMDLRYPSIHHYLGIETEYGVVDIVKGQASIEEVMITPDIERLTVIPGKHRYRNSSEIIASHAVQAMVKELRNRYRERIIIFDAPPLLGCDDVAVLSPLIDACLMIVEENNTRYSELDQAIEKLGNVPLLGYVLNKSKGKHFDQYYY